MIDYVDYRQQEGRSERAAAIVGEETATFALHNSVWED